MDKVVCVSAMSLPGDGVDGANIGDAGDVGDVGNVGPRFAGAHSEDKVGNLGCVGNVGDVGPRFAGTGGVDKVGDEKLPFLFWVGVVHAALWIARDWA